MKKAVIFDNEWIIIKNDWEKVAQAFAREFNIPEISGKQFKQSLKCYDSSQDNPLYQWNRGEISREDFWTKILDQYGIEASQKNIKRASSQLEHLTTDVNSESLGLVRALKESGYKVYMLTNSTPEIHRGNRERDGYFQLFDGIFVSYEIGSRKPEPAIYHHLLKKINLAPEECVFIDDKPENVEGAQKVGIDGIEYKLDQPIQKLKDHLKEKGYRF